MKADGDAGRNRPRRGQTAARVHPQKCRGRAFQQQPHIRPCKAAAKQRACAAKCDHRGQDHRGPQVRGASVRASHLRLADRAVNRCCDGRHARGRSFLPTARQMRCRQAHSSATVAAFEECGELAGRWLSTCSNLNLSLQAISGRQTNWSVQHDDDDQQRAQPPERRRSIAAAGRCLQVRAEARQPEVACCPAVNISHAISANHPPATETIEFHTRPMAE